MARTNLDAWIPEQYGSDVLEVVRRTSAVEAAARREPMNSDTKRIPRSGGIDVHVVEKGAVYNEEVGSADDVLLTARKFGSAVRIADEDLADSPANVIAIKQREWATSYAVKFDNAALGTTGAENGTTVPFTSAYAAATAAGNRIQTAGDVTYAQLSNALGVWEESAAYTPEGTIVIANPAFVGALREVTDGNGRPIFQEGAAAGDNRLFGYRFVTSTGARTSATASSSPAGNPLLIVAGADALVVGDREPIQFMVSKEQGFLSDETVLKARTRKGFAVTRAEAVSVLEITPAGP